MKAFFDAIRPAFGGKLTTDQVVGMEALLEEGMRLGTPLQHMGYVLANVRRETGGRMYPIKETVMPYHKDANPSDATVIARLDRAWAKGQLKWVSKPYWRDGWFGRGDLQITHKDNYAKMGPLVGADLVKKRDLALDPRISARIAIIGMTRGTFTGKKLGDYQFPQAIDNPVKTNPRRIVNGNDGSDSEVAGFHRDFVKALEAAGWGLGPAKDYEVPDPAPAPKPAAKPSESWFVALIRALFGRRR